MKQNRSIMIPTVGNTTERMMICVGWPRLPGVELPVKFSAECTAAEPSAGVAGEATVVETAARAPTNVGMRCDGGIEAVQPSNPSVAKMSEYASSRKEE